MLKSPRLAALVFAATGLACSPTTTNSTTPPDPSGAPAGGPTLGSPPADGTGGATGTPDPNAAPGPNGQTSTGTVGGPTAGTGANPDRFLGPEISHSRGVAGGVVVLWPRIIPGTSAEENAAIAAQVQAKVRAVAEKALPGRPIDVRPKPERVCPKTGCDAMSIGVLFSKNTTACVAVALINGPGVSQTKMIPWSGSVEFKTGTDTIAFRDMPENFVKIKDFTPCDQLITNMAEQDQFIEAAIRAAASASAPAGATGTSPPVKTGPGGGPSSVSAKPPGAK